MFPFGFHVDTGRKLNVHKTFRRRSERLMYVQFTSCGYGVNITKIYLEPCKISMMVFFAKMGKVFSLAEVFSYEFCEISKNTFFTEHLWMTASIRG